MGIVQEIREEIASAYQEPTSRELTILAGLFLVIPSVIGSYYLFWKGSDSGYYWIGAGAALCLCRLIPPLFRRIYRTWIKLAVILGYFISRGLLTILFIVVMVPTGLIMRLSGKDPMERKFDPDAPSYWIKREHDGDYSVERYEKQF